MTPPKPPSVRRLVAWAASRPSAVAASLAVATGLGAAGAVIGGFGPVEASAAVMVAGHGAVALVGAFVMRHAARSAYGVSRRVWRLFGVGLASWLVGCTAYVAFLATGGSPLDPAEWTQIGFLAAYVPWYRALWLMRQPILGRSVRQRCEAALVELVAFGLMVVVLGAGVWHRGLSAGQNLTLLLPAALDLLLVAGLYNAVRRSRLTLATAHGWFALGFSCLALTDTAVTVLIPRGYFEVGGLALAGYAVALGFVGTAAARPLRVTETQRGVSRSSAAVGLLSLALVAPAAALLPLEGRVVVWGIGGVLVVWLWSRVAVSSDGDADVLTGMLRPEALQRHLSVVLTLARDDRPAGILLVQIDGIGEWTEREGYRAADDLVQRVAGALEDLELPEGGVWSRTSADGFAWLGVIADGDSARRLATLVHGVVSATCTPLVVHCGAALVPGDADSPDDAMDAAREAVTAAAAADRAVVLFDRGRLDGLPPNAGYGTSLRTQRARITEIMESESLLEAVFQPIVDLERMRVLGYEALSRFHCEPRRGPDLWIADAHTVGLGIQLEAECIRRAVAQRSKAPTGRYISLNTSPELLLSPLLDEALAGHRLDGLVLEITEHHHVSDYAELADRLALLRGRGARVAIDDVGAGHSSMRHVMNLRPDMIKVDRWMVTDIGVDSGRRALMRSFVALSAELGADLVIEGVETADELSALRELGVVKAQGYLFARPDRAFQDVAQGPDGDAGDLTPPVEIAVST